MRKWALRPCHLSSTCAATSVQVRPEGRRPPAYVDSYMALDSGAVVIKALSAEFLCNLLQLASNLVYL
jgi:hypothetical protein